MKKNIRAAIAMSVAGLLIPAQPAWADCPEIEIPYSAADIAYAERARPILATALVAPPPGWQIYSNPNTTWSVKEFSYCEYEKRPKVIPPIPVMAKATYRRRSESFGYTIYIIANNSWSGKHYYERPIRIDKYSFQVSTFGTINPAEKSKLAGFTIIYEGHPYLKGVMSAADLADLDQMVDKARLQQLIDQPLPEAAEAKAQLAAHVQALDARPATAAKPVKTATDTAPGQPAEPAKPKKPAKPKLRLPGGFPRIPSF